MPGQIYFGDAYADYARGEPVDWQTYGDMVRRPEDEGADVRRYGKVPRPWSMMVVIFGTTMSAVLRAKLKWEAELWQVRTLYVDRAASYILNGVVLQSIWPVGGMRALKNASNGANYMLWVNLVFSRVAETT